MLQYFLNDFLIVTSYQAFLYLCIRTFSTAAAAAAAFEEFIAKHHKSKRRANVQ